jgi:ribosomal protein S18 acetylase RimI-like enzyme
MEQQIGNLIFKPIDLLSDGETCVRFSEDAHIASFGNADRFHEKDGKGAERYLAWLKKERERDPFSCVHVWLDSKIIGQMTLGRLKADPGMGYVSLYYLIPEHRGSGLSRYLDEFACTYLKSLGFTLARLSVHPENVRALAYYRKHGWRDLGPRPDHPELNWMEKEI